MSFHPKSVYLDNVTSDIQAQLNFIKQDNSSIVAISGALTNYTLLTTTAAISANLQNQINVSRNMQWITISGASQSMTSNKGYITTNGSVTNLTMPSNPSPGDAISIVDNNAAGWVISLTGAQTIQISGSTQVTSGGLQLKGLSNSYANLICLTSNRAILKGRGNTILQ